MTRRFAIGLGVIAASIVTLSAQSRSGTPIVDWQPLKPEVLRRYRELVQLNTTAGHETLAVNYLRSVLESEGIQTETFALDPARANLVARIKGNGSKRPLLILAHTDVVGVQRDKWPVDPFGAVLKDGYVWGRGTKDDKPVLAANLMTMLLLKRMGVALDRDVIFLAESGEEADTTGVGINFVVREHFAAIDAEFAMTEGGAVTTDASGRTTRVNLQTAEKLPARARLVARGTAGHGSAPRTDNPLIHLSAAVARVGRWEPPMRFIEATRNYFERLGQVAEPEFAPIYKALLNPATARDAQAVLRERRPAEYSMLRTSVVPTMLQAGVGANVIPSEAEATLDIRALPGEDIDAFYAEMAKVIDDPAVRIEPLPRTRPASPASRLDTEMYRALERVANQMFPGAPVLPAMSTGASDQAQLRAKGIQSYGVGPGSTDDDAINYPAHGDVERLAEASLYPFVEYVWRVVIEVAAHK